MLLSIIFKLVVIIQKLYEVVKWIIVVLKSCSSMLGFRIMKDIFIQLVNVFFMGMFMFFQLIVFFVINNGYCGKIEKIVMGVFLVVFVVIIVVFCFMDSVKVFSIGKVYYGLVIIKGLWNLSFQGLGILGVFGVYYIVGGSKYMLRVFDFVIVVFLLFVFVILLFFMDFVFGCYWK